MAGLPSVTAWAALAALVTVVTLGMFVGAPKTRMPAREFVLPGWLLPVAGGVAHAPAFLAWFLDAPWQTVAWWLLFASPATAVILVVGGTAALIAVRWPTRRHQLAVEEKPIVPLVVGLTVAAAIAVPVVATVVIALEGDVRLAAALALIAGYVPWRLTLALVRRSPVFAAPTR